MHIHTLYSNRKNQIIILLQAIIIVDNKKMTSSRKVYFRGKLLLGAEMNVTLDDRKRIEFLVYNIKKIK